MAEVVANTSGTAVVVQRQRTATVVERRADAVIAQENGEPRVIAADRGPRGLQGEPGEFVGTTDEMVEGSTNLFFTNARARAAAPIQSVNGEAGDVILDADDVGADPVGTAVAAASSAVAIHKADPDPHPQYLAPGDEIDGGNF